MKVIAIIQVRIESERLPGKVLMKLPYGNGKTLLKWITDSIRNSEIVDKCIVATSVNRENDQIEEFCNKNNLQCFRGSEEDVLSRFITITKNEEADVVIRLTGDNPILDTGILDQVINEHLDSDSDYTASHGLPLGMNFEIISGQAFLSIDEEPTQDEMEHVTLYFKNREEFTKQSISVSEDEELKHLRVTVDYPEDFLVMSHLLSSLKKDELPSFSLVKRVFVKTPWAFRANLGKTQKRIFSDFAEEKIEAVQLLRKYGFKKSAERLENV